MSLNFTTFYINKMFSDFEDHLFHLLIKVPQALINWNKFYLV